MSTDKMITMDSRKFMGIINNSAQAKIRFFEEKVRDMGKGVQKEWKLVSLGSKGLVFEDTSEQQYYQAKHFGSGSRITISDIEKVNIVEDIKRGVFSEACQKLITAIAENNTRDMQSAYDTMKSLRFTGATIPSNGYVQTRDGVVRKINISESTLPNFAKNQIIKFVIEQHKDRVVVDNGTIVEGHFTDGTPFKLPTNKWTAKKLVARRMVEAAKNAYTSPGFQSRMLNTANLVSESKVEDAVAALKPFLGENEEFTLLTRGQVQTLIESALATQAIFNQSLCNDVATLFHKTNLRLNRDKIVKEWKKIARAAEHPALVENVMVLAESKNFEATYDKFLTMIFEAISNREVAAEALATTLSVLRDKTPKIKESHDLSSKLTNLISRLKAPNFDDAALYEAEDLIATIQEELTANETLTDFDQIPGGEEDPLAGAGDEMDMGGQTPVININSPLIQIGGSSAGGAGPDAPPAGGPDIGDGLDLDSLALDDMDEEDPLAASPDLNAPTAPVPPAAPPPQQGVPRLEGRSRTGRALNESRPVHYEMRDEEDDDMPELAVEEDEDPYAIKESVSVGANVHSYGAPVFADRSQVDTILKLMRGLQIEHKLKGNALVSNLPSMAEACIKSCGYRIPSGRLPLAIRQVVGLYSEEWQKPWLKDKEEGSDTDTDSVEEECDEDCEMAEAIESPEVQTIDQPEGGPFSNLHKESVQWLERQHDALLGEFNGVRFIFDHGGPGSSLEPVVVSESDQSVEIPVPKSLRESAYAAAGLKAGDGSKFTRWLSGSIEQLRPLSEDENAALNEAILTITTTDDGGMNLKISPDVEVGEMDPESMQGIDGGLTDSPMGDEPGMEMGGGDDLGMEADPAMAPELGGEEVDGSAPDMGAEVDGGNPFGEEEPAGEMSAVDSVSAPGPAAPGGPGGESEEESMPNFEKQIGEDMDITAPDAKKYTKEANGDKRDTTDAKLPGFSGDTLEAIGPDLKKDDGTGTKSPTAGKNK